jgi:hypothetical protein
MDEISGKAKGGFARAEILPPERRTEIAQRAALARWQEKIPRATHEGVLTIGDLELPVAVLDDGTRLLLSKAFLTALGRPWKGTYRRTERPNFIDAQNLNPFISNELEGVLAPIEYRDLRGQKVVGYRAELLPMVCDVYLAARAAGAINNPRQQRVAAQAEILVRSLSKIGIIALVDEATGYQRDRAKDALARILEQFIAKELQPWVKTFPDEFYEQLFRLRDLEYPHDGVKRPQYFGHLTNDIIYRRLAPGVLKELRELTPRRDDGRLKHAMHRRLSGDTGHPKLREHLASVTTIMKLSEDYDDFVRKLDRIHPRYGETMEIPFDDGEIETKTGL